MIGRSDACARCGDERHLIRDDGTVVCRPCLMRYGDIVGRPERLTLGEATLLTEAHGDVAALGIDACVHAGDRVLAWWHYVLRWRWIATDWPEAGEPASEGLDEVIAQRLAELRSHDR